MNPGDFPEYSAEAANKLGLVTADTPPDSTEPEHDENVLRFTGRRIKPTIHDVKLLREFVDGYIQNLEKNQIDGIGLILTTSRGTAHIDWMLLPGANKHALLSGTHLLGSDLITSFNQDYEEEISDGN